jgi:hypothetical protein
MSTSSKRARRKAWAETSHMMICVSNLTSIFHGRKEHEEVEALHWRALKAREEKLGKDHPDTLIRINKLRMQLQDQGKLKEAEELK